jgi:hypothetical protein
MEEMIMKKNIIATVLVISLFLLQGCTGGSKQTVTTDNPYLGGSQGLVATFDPMGVSTTSAAQSIFDDENFPLTINLKNKGEFTVPSGTMKTIIKGISPSDYTGITFEKTNSEAIEKISLANTQGGITTIDHGNGKLVANRIKDRNILNANIFADVIYPYKTFISAPKVCFKDDTTKTRDDTICDIENSALQVFSSGAPIRAVSAKEVRSGKGLISVEFSIENAGGGESKNPANADFDYRYNEIAFEVQESSTPSKWDCRSSGRAGTGRFDESNKLAILCKLTTVIPSNQVYQSQLDLTLKYDYKSIISTDLLIKNKDT